VRDCGGLHRIWPWRCVPCPRSPGDRTVPRPVWPNPPFTWALPPAWESFANRSAKPSWGRWAGRRASPWIHGTQPCRPGIGEYRGGAGRGAKPGSQLPHPPGVAPPSPTEPCPPPDRTGRTGRARRAPDQVQGGAWTPHPAQRPHPSALPIARPVQQVGQLRRRQGRRLPPTGPARPCAPPG
jgi:hypothetical protein